jgi:FecR protein/WD40-like Beta Propeller Repeat
MTAAYFGEGGYGAPASVIDADSAHADHIVVADAQLLFTAHFHRAGPDLVLTGRDGHSHIIPGYFSSEHPPALVAPNGAMLSPHLVDLLAGSAAPNEYAQAGPVTPPAQIGRVEKVVGEVTVIRNGAAVTLNVGDPVYKSDVIQTAAGSSAGVSFPDGSALNLVANTRMALSDYSYDPNSTSNSALFNLVEGGLSFVAGKVAHTGDMKIGTPIATMGIRGTAGWLYEEQVANITANAGNVTLHFAAVFDSVTNTESTYTLYAVDANGELQHDAQGRLMALATVSSTQNGLVTTLTGQGIGNLPSVGTAPPDITQQQFANLVVPQVIDMAIQAIQQYQQQQQNQPTNPQSNPSSSGSGTPPGTNNNNDNQPLQKIIDLGNGSPPVTITGTVTPLVSNPTPSPTTQTPPTTPTGPQIRTFDPPAESPPQIFNTPPDWPTSAGAGGVPEPTDSIVDNSPVPLVIPDSRTVNNLTIGTGALVHVVGSNAPGSLTVRGTTDTSGMIQADSTKADPIVTFDNAVTVHAGGEIQALAQGNSASIIFDSSVTLEAAADLTPGGKIDANGSGASLTLNDGATIAAGAEVESSGSGASVFITGSAGVDNSGTMIADNGGALTLFNVQVRDGATGVIEAIDAGSLVSLSGSDIVGGTLETGDPTSAAHGVIEVGAGLEATFFDGSTSAGAVTVDAFIQVDEGASLDLVGAIDNEGTFSVASGATLSLAGATLDGGAVADLGNIDITSSSEITGGAVIQGDVGSLTVDSSAILTLDDVTFENLDVTNNGTLQVDSDHTLFLSDVTVTGGEIDSAGTVAAVGSATLQGNTVVNSGTLEAVSGGMLQIDDDVANSGVLKANGGTVVVSGAVTGTGSATITNGGTFEVGASDAQTVTFDDASTLKLDQPAEFTGHIDGLAIGDIIDLTDMSVDSTSLDGSTLTVHVTDGPTLTYQVGGALDGNYFAIQSDNADGDELVLSPAVAPTLSVPAKLAVDEDKTVAFDITETPINANDPVSITVAGLPSGATLSAGALNEDGTWTLTPAELSGLTLSAGEDTSATLTITATDTVINAASTQIISLTVNPVAEGPVLGGATSATVSEGGLVAFGATDLKLDADDTLGAVMISGLPGDLSNISGGSYDAETGIWTGTAAQFNALSFNAGEQGTFALSISAATTGVEDSTTTESYTLAVNAAAPTVTVPTIGGTAQEGQALTASVTVGQFDGAPTYTWYSSADNFTNAIGAGSTYQVKEADEGFKIEVKATATNDNGVAVTQTSAQTTAVIDVTPTVTVPTIGGTAQEGQTLTAVATAGQADNALTYTWYSSADNFTNAIGAGSTYQVKEADAGFKIEVKATATNDNGVAVTHTSAETATVPVVALTDEWINTNGGTWTDVANAATNWSAGALPRSIDSVLIDQSGAAPYVVTLPSGASVTIASLTLDNAHATLSNQGALTLGGPLTIDAGTFQLSGNGAFSGATSITNGGTIDFAESFTLTNSVANTGGNIQVDAGHTLTLSGISISGGEIDLGQGSEQIQSVSEISVPGLHSYAPAMSGDGEFIAFVAANSLPGSGDSGEHMELFDSATGVSTDISALIPAGDLHAGERFHDIPSISADGRYVVFSGEYQFTNNDGGNGPQTFTQTEGFLYDRVAQSFTALTEASGAIVISGNGQFVASEGSSAGNSGVHVLVMNDAGTVLTEIEGNPNYTPPDNMSDNFGNIGSVYDPGISSSGRFVSFWSTSSEISIVGGSTFQTGDSDGTAQVYVYDRQSNALQMASVNDLGQAGNGDSGTLSLGDQHDSDWTSSLSANGRYVVFQSAASNLAGNTTPGDSNIFLYDTWTHTTQLVSAGVGGAAADGASDRPEISADGNYVSFSSDATNIVAGGTDGTAETYVYNTQTGAITLVAAAADGTPADGESDLASTLSADGSVVAYGGVADNLGPTANPGFANVFVDNLNQTAPGALDITADTTITGGATINGGAVTVEAGATLTLDGVTIDGSTVDLASATATTESVSHISVPPSFAIAPAISADGGSLAFVAATSLPGENNGNGDIGGDVDLYNVATSQLTDLSQLVPDPQEGESYGSIPSISADGHYVVFEGNYSIPNPDPEFGPPTLKQSELYLYDGHEVTALKSNVWQAEISGNGQFIVASSNGPIGQSFGDDILIMDRSGNVLTTITGNPNYVPPQNQTDSFGNGASVEDPAISADGRYVSFWSTSSAIAINGGPPINTGDTNGIAQVYIYDLQSHTLQMVSVNNHGQQGNGDSGATSLNTDNNNNSNNSDWASSFSADGRFVVFQSAATNLAPGGGTPAGNSNIYIYDLQTHTIALVSAAAGGAPGLGNSIRPDISPDGQYVTFASDASNLPGANGASQTYIVAINAVTGAVAGGPELASTGFAGFDNGQNELGNAVSNGGTVAAFGGAALAFNVGQDVLVGSGQAQLLSAAAGTVKFTGLGVTDDNAAGTTLTVTLSVEHGTLAAVASGSGLTIVGDNDGSHGTLEFSGSLDAVNAALQSGVVYTPTEYNPNAPWPDALMGTVEDGHGNTATVTGQFDPQAQGIFTGGTSNGEYDIFLANESTAPQGAIDVTADTAISNTTVNGGTLTVESDVTFTLDNVVLNGVHLVVDGGEAPSIRIDAGDTLTWAGTSAFTGPGPVVIENDGHIIHEGTLDVGFSQITFQGSGTVTENGGNHGLTIQTLINEGNTFDGFGQMGDSVGGLTIDNEAGTFDADVAGNALVLETGNTIVNDDTFKATNGGTLKILNSTLDNEHSIIADSGTVIVGGPVTGGGSATIENNGILELGSTDAQAVTFNDASTLRLDHQDQGDAQAYTGTVANFAVGDAIVLTNIAYSATETDLWNNATGTLTVANGTTTATVSFSPAGNYAQNDFALESDASGNTEVVYSPTNVTLTGLSNLGNAVTGTPVEVALSDSSLQDVAYTWLVGGQLVSGDDTNSYIPIANDEGKTLDVLASFIDPATGATEHDTVLAGTVQAPEQTFSPTVGSAIETSLSLKAGDVVTFDWDFVAHDYLPYNDFSFVTVNHSASLLSDVQLVGDYGASGWHTFAFTAPTDGSYSLGMGQFDDIDQLLNSHLLVDNVRVDGVVAQSFETGTFAGWSPTGDASVVSSEDGANPTDGNYMAFLDSASSPESTVETFLGLSSGALTELAAGVTLPPTFVDPTVTPGTSDVVGDIAFTDASSPDGIVASSAPGGANYLGTFSLDQPSASNGVLSVSFEFNVANDQIDLAPGETLTQSYNVTLADAQNPAANVRQTITVTIGGPGNDNFVFAPGVGADTVTNFNPQQDTIELNHFTDAQTIQELQSLITADVHGDAVINLGHNDSITLANTTTTQVQQAVQAGHVLLH